MSVVLRPYQKEALDSVVDYLSRDINKQLIVLPTGSGKTVIFSSLPQVLQQATPMLVLAHRGELLSQAKEKILWFNPDLDVQTEKAEHFADLCDVVVASVPTLGRSDSDRILKYPKDYFKTIIVDEAHHAAAESYRRVLEYFTPTLLLGVTATPQRGDSVRLTDVFQEIVYYKNILDLIQEGYLCRLVGYRIKTDTDISEVETLNGDFHASQLEDTINNPGRNALVVKSYMDIVKDKKALVFAAGVQHAKDLAASFRSSQISVRVVLGDTPEDERSKIFSDFRSGRLKVIVNVGVLTEGFDEPTVEAIILARPTRSPLLYTQIVGRGTRLSAGKPNCVIVDIADTTKGKKPLGLPTLLGMPADFDLNGHDLLDVAQKYKELESYCPGEAVRVLSPQDIDLAYKRIDLFMPPPPNVVILQYSTFVWAETAENEYHLGLSNTESMKIYIDTLGRWTTALVSRVSGTTKPKEQVLGYTQDIREAFARSDKWVVNNRSYAVKLIDNEAAWRAGAPTEKQTRLLKSMGVPITADMTKGTASRIIDHIIKNDPEQQKKARQRQYWKNKKYGGGWS
jgi:ATP-dependent helicase IRC3